MFIEKLNFTADVLKVRKDLETILTKTSWGFEKQIGLTYRPGATNLWKDSTGSLYDRKNKVELIKENEFTEFNKDTPEYLTSLLDNFAKFQNIEIGRARFMCLEPKKGLTVHSDNSERYHLVVATNENSYIANTMKSSQIAAICYKLPVDGFMYRVDTTKEHFVYNGGDDNRIHLVISPRD